MEEKLNQICENAQQELSLASDKQALNACKVKYLGKQGALTEVLRGMRDVPAEDRPKIGALVNKVRDVLEDAFAKKEAQFDSQQLEKELANSYIDITEPGEGHEKGALHPLSRTFEKLVDICVDMGFQVVDGPEVELDYFNFEALNIPKITQREICKTHSLCQTTFCFVRKHHLFKQEQCKNLNHLLRLYLREEYTETTAMQLIRQYSTKWKGLLWMKTCRWQTLKAC